MLSTLTETIGILGAFDPGTPAVSVFAIALALVTILLWRRYAIEDQAFPLALLAMPYIYVVFALYSDTTSTALYEVLASLPFVAIALYVIRQGRTRTAMVLAFGWALHGAYDLGHDVFFTNNGTPVWYPVACGVFDFTVATYLLYAARVAPKPA